MNSRSTLAAVALAAVTTLTLGLGASAASASHFRASGPDFVVDGDVATWVITTAWESNDADYFEGLGGTTEVLEIESYSDTPGSGIGTGVTLEVVSEESSDKPLYAETVETFVGDLSELDDGLYELFVDNCCRVDDIQNSAAEDFSQWVRFSKTGSTYAIAPRLTNPVIYAPLALNGTTTMVSYSAPGAATWTVLTDSDGPYFGAGDLPCSVLVGAALEIGSEHCDGGEVYSEIYTAGSFWAIKLSIADAGGRESVAETLFRVESIPEPYIDNHEWTGNGTSAKFWAFASDVIVNSWVITCTNTADATDVVSGSGTSIPVQVNGFTAGEEYGCVAAGTNGAGTGESEDEYFVTPPAIDLDLQFGIGDFYAGKVAVSQGSGLDSETDYSLVMFSDPLTLLEGVTDSEGAFLEEVTIPEEACIPGRHEIRLTGIAAGGGVRASQYVEIDENCIVVDLRATPWGDDEELAATGAPQLQFGLGIAGVLAALGAALVMSRRRWTIESA